MCIYLPNAETRQDKNLILCRIICTIMKKRPQSWNRDFLVSLQLPWGYIVKVGQSVKSALPSRSGVTESFGWSDVTIPQRIPSNPHVLLDVEIAERIRVDVFCSEWSG